MLVIEIDFILKFGFQGLNDPGDFLEICYKHYWMKDALLRDP